MGIIVYHTIERVDSSGLDIETKVYVDLDDGVLLYQYLYRGPVVVGTSCVCLPFGQFARLLINVGAYLQDAARRGAGPDAGGPGSKVSKVLELLQGASVGPPLDPDPISEPDDYFGPSDASDSDPDFDNWANKLVFDDDPISDDSDPDDSDPDGEPDELEPDSDGESDPDDSEPDSKPDSNDGWGEDWGWGSFFNWDNK